MCVMVVFANITHSFCQFFCPYALWWGIKETFVELFGHLECVPNYDGNLKDYLFVVILQSMWNTIQVNCRPQSGYTEGLHSVQAE